MQCDANGHATPSCLILTPGRIAHRMQGEKCLVNRIVDLIEFTLKRIEKFVQAAADDLLNRRVVELRSHAPKALFSRIGKRAHRRAGHGVQRLFRIHNAVLQGPGKLAVQN